MRTAASLDKRFDVVHHASSGIPTLRLAFTPEPASAPQQPLAAGGAIPGPLPVQLDLTFNARAIGDDVLTANRLVAAVSVVEITVKGTPQVLAPI